MAVRALDGVLALHTMRFADEVVDAGELDAPEPAPQAPTEREIEMAGSSSTRCTRRSSRRLRRQYREAVLAADQAQGARARRSRPPEEPERGPDDLTAALEASLADLMARSLWTGSLSFGLVNVPVALFSACATSTCTSASCTTKDDAPVETRRVCSQEDVEVAVRGDRPRLRAKTASRSSLTDDELAAAAPRKTRTIDIEAFVELEEIDPIYFDHPYFLVPAGDTDGTAAPTACSSR